MKIMNHKCTKTSLKKILKIHLNMNGSHLELIKINFWLHYQSSTHQLMMKLISEIIWEPKKKPDWFTEEIVYLLPKTKETTNAKKTKKTKKN